MQGKRSSRAQEESGMKIVRVSPEGAAIEDTILECQRVAFAYTDKSACNKMEPRHGLRMSETNKEAASSNRSGRHVAGLANKS